LCRNGGRRTTGEMVTKGVGKEGMRHGKSWGWKQTSRKRAKDQREKVGK